MNILVHNKDAESAPGGEEDVLNSLAWTTTTSKNPALRDGSSAVDFSEKGAKTQGFRSLGSFARRSDRIMQREEKPGQSP
jgi:hypothetical protein